LVVIVLVKESVWYPEVITMFTEAYFWTPSLYFPLFECYPPI